MLGGLRSLGLWPSWLKVLQWWAMWIRLSVFGSSFIVWWWKKLGTCRHLLGQQGRRCRWGGGWDKPWWRRLLWDSWNLVEILQEVCVSASNQTMDGFRCVSERSARRSFDERSRLSYVLGECWPRPQGWAPTGCSLPLEVSQSQNKLLIAWLCL